ncbi:MAG: DUF4197 family protein [Bacteroidetes bacterium]|nr:DUF4197 family protein [Bacteroidota bacterium]
MNGKYLAFSLLLLVSMPSCDPETLNSILATAGGAAGVGSISNGEAIMGLKDALKQGANNGAGTVSKLNGYFGNPLIKIPLPPEAEPIVNTLSKVPGGQKLLDDAMLAINRAAEEAAKEAAPIFVSAITSMTISDGMDILFGEQDAATRYLERTTTPQLTAKFSPVIDKTMASTNATKYWGDVMNAYNKIPLVKKVNPDLGDFVTERALLGLFVMVEKEEQKIRTNPGARTTDMMKKVFGYYDSNKK